MKKLLCLLAFCLLSWSLVAQSTITATITATNAAGTSAGDTITVNGSVYTWTNSTTSLRNIATTNSAANVATNLYTKFRTTLTNRYFVTYGSATSVLVKSTVGQPLTVTISTNWATVSLATNTAGGATVGSSNVFANSITLSGVAISSWDDINGPTNGITATLATNIATALDVIADAKLAQKTNPVISGTLTLDNGAGYRTIGTEGSTNTYIAAQQGKIILEGQQGVELRGNVTGNAASLTNINAGNFTNVMYVSPTGDDNNSGASWGEAKKTLLAAYDAVTYNGIIHFANNSTVGGATNQGLWFMSASDPNYGQPGYPSATNAVGTNGWRLAKYVKWVGESGNLGSTISFGHAGGAKIIPGTGGTWARSTNNPAIWLAGENSMTFHNMTISGAAICVRAGISSTGTAISTARFKFENCQFAISQETTGDDGNLGQCFDFGSAFWVDIIDCVLLGNVSADIPSTSDRRAVILCRPPAPGDLSSFLINIERNVWSGGGMKYYPGSGYGIVTMSHVIAEAAYTEIAPIFWVIGSHGNLYARITDCDTADASLPAGMQTVQIDSDSDLSSGNIVVDHGKVNGPATIIGSYAQEGKTNNPHAKKQMGFSDGSVWGSTDAFRRNYAPTFVPYTNIVSGVLPSGAAWVTGPNGMTNALTGTATGSSIASFRLQTTSVPLAVGDWLVFGTWMRVTNGNHQNGSVGQCFITINASNKFRDGTSALSRSPKFKHAGWQWLWNYNQITNASVSPDSIYTTVNYYTNSPIEVWNPTIIRIPAGEMTENDVAELATHMSGWPATVAAGSVAMQKFQRLAMWDAGSNAFNYLSLDSGMPRVTQRDGTVIAPYLNGTNIIAATINSNKLDAATLALLGAGGGGSVTNLTNNTGLPGLLVGSGLGTNLASLVVKTNPVISGTLTLDNGSGYRTVGAENVTNTYIAAQQGRVILEGQQGVELRGGITGSGSGLTNITAHTAIVSGTISNAQIAAATINSNRFDAATLAKLYEAGGGSGLSNLTENASAVTSSTNIIVTGGNVTLYNGVFTNYTIGMGNYLGYNGLEVFYAGAARGRFNPAGGALYLSSSAGNALAYKLDITSSTNANLASPFGDLNLNHAGNYYAKQFTSTNGVSVLSNSWPFIGTNTLANGQLAIGSSNGTFTVRQKNHLGVETTNQFPAGIVNPLTADLDFAGKNATNVGVVTATNWIRTPELLVGNANLTNTYVHWSNGVPTSGFVFATATGRLTNGIGEALSVGSVTAPAATLTAATITTANIQTNNVTFMRTTNFFIGSNAISAWPTAPDHYGDAYWGNSNGVIYLLTATNISSLTWTATNRIAP